MDFTPGRSTPRRPDESKSRSAGARQKPADWLLRNGQQVHGGDESVDKATNVSPPATWPAQLISASCPLIKSSGTCVLRSPALHRHPIRPTSGEQLGRRAYENRDVVTGGDRLDAARGDRASRGAQDDDAGHSETSALRSVPYSGNPGDW